MITLPGVDPRMIANNTEPFEPTHPGELLKEEIEYRGLSQRKLAEQMGMSCSVLKEILQCKRPVTIEYALLFEAALGIESAMLVKMQTSYNFQTIKRDKSFSRRLAKARQLAAAL